MVNIQRVNAATFDDHTQLLSLLREAFLYMHDRIDPPSSLNRLNEEKLSNKIRDEILFVALHNNKLVGCVFARPDKDFIYLGKLAVKQDHRGLGLSRLLIDQVEACAVSLGLFEVEIETRVELVENQALFVHLGYHKTAERCHQGFDRPTSFCYRKVLFSNNL